ncbi:MAG: Response regulator receiver protein [Pedosphaera sp.]|nr:Response regulator receiver protein [Pedosphaera sp.]
MPDSKTSVKKVLFVDDNLQFLEMIERLMGNWSQGEWQIFTALNSGKALLLLQEHAFDLAVVDVQMPVVDGIQFLALLNRKYPNLQKVTLSAYADEAARTACLSQGAELFLEKPRDPADLEIIFGTLRELARHKPVTTGFRGVLRQVSLEDVIQMECLNRNSSILEVVARNWVGQIFIKEGTLLHAQVGDRNGEAALNKILSLRGGEFNLKPFVDPPQQSIDGPWEFLLMEAARVRDESRENGTEETHTTEPAAPAPVLPVPAPPVHAAEFVPPAATYVPAAVGSRSVRVDEMIVCSAKGEVIYEWQCPNIGDRISFLEFLSQKSVQLGEGLNLGSFDRLEMESEKSRVIAQVKTDRGIFVRATKGAVRRPVEPATPAS